MAIVTINPDRIETQDPDLSSRTKEGMICQRCKKRKATENWTNEGGLLAFIHGMYQQWCRICCLEEQLRFARKQAAGIPNLEKILVEELKKEKISDPT